MNTRVNITSQQLDELLKLQFRVAWAGEGLCDPPRLKWWRTDLVDPMSGADLMMRLAPRTQGWAALEAVREAARLVDQKSRQQMADPDSVRTLFFWGFELDELLADRIREQKWALAAAPDQGEFDRGQLEKEFKALAPEAGFNIQSSGRQLRGPQPADPVQAARMLVACLSPWSDSYPTPFFRL